MSKQSVVIEKFKKDILYPLKRESLKFDNFKDFSKSYSIYGNHGLYFHITDNPNWLYDPQKGSRDMSSMASGEVLDKGSLMVSSDFENWDYIYNFDDDENPKQGNTRDYVALIDLGDVKYHIGFGRGFGHEIYIYPEEANKIIVLDVLSIKDGRLFYKKWQNKRPQSEKELYNKVWMNRYIETETESVMITKFLEFNLFESSKTIIGYHGGYSIIKKFNIPLSDYTTGLFFTNNQKVAMWFGKYLYKVQLTLKNPFIVDAKESYYYDIKTPSEMKKDIYIKSVDTDIIARWAYKKGYDSVIIKNVFEGNGSSEYGDDYIIFNNDCIEKFENLGEIETYSIWGAKFKRLKKDNSILESKKHHEFIRIEKNPYELVHATGEAGTGIYFSLSKYPQMIKYYKKLTPEGYRVISAHPKKETIIYDFTRPENLTDLLSYMREEIDKLSKRMTHYIKPKINQSNYQRYGTMIEDYIRRKLNNKVDAYIVNHEMSGSYLPKGKQMIIINEESFDYEESN